MPRQPSYLAQLTVRLTPDERERIQAHAAQAGLSVARFLVESALVGAVPLDPEGRARLDAALFVARRDLRGVAAQLRDLRRQLQGSGQMIPADVTTTLAALREVLRHLEKGMD